MVTGSLALAAAAAFTGASLYVNFVEQPARLRLDDKALLAEWEDSDHRGFVILAGLALVSAALGFVHYKSEDDFRWLVGAATIIAAWPFMFFAIVPLNNRILALIAAEAGPEARKTIELWGRLELGLTALGAAATSVYVFATA
ncbi:MULTISPECIES: DUF1772 domain-containing protein [Methylosinus]|uniref:DUF1772 domain-containing protein n=1 Tax=Methylosinus trichosporium (strain ATCC 35070 / NCIMB 11131 / UNIQEM 75 / OB3b) TaxID=595536 RepID=A0A2D2D2Z4_METT3|nr:MULTISPECIES: DUF1772 domain-containing protein [Methylosinus]ATQ69368.1 DUF1772 domain-containing protein [Methylosinus trichosporium OB3b]OBS52882.1 hypothetical protein A8B73_08270 [Methylosinus sp. 3S-1]